MLAFRLAGRLTGCGNRRVCHGGMLLRRHRCRLDQHLSANRAMLAFGLARLLAGCRNSRVNLHDMVRCGQVPLRLQRLIADRAVRSVTPARLGTGRRLAVVNDLRVSLRRQNLLERERPHTHGAVHALAHADGNAGRLHARQGNQGMIRQRHLFLCLHDCSARTAMGAFRQSLLHTGCGDGGIGHHGVSVCRNCFLFNNGHSADRAHAPLGTAVLGTGRCTGRQHLLDVSAEGRGNLSAYQANLILRTGGNVRVVCMSRGRDRLQTVQDGTASLPSAPRSAGVSRRLAGRLQFRNLHRNVIQLVQDSLRHDFNPANRAERTAGPAEVFAGRFLTGLKHFLVRQLRHRLRRRRTVAADLTFIPLGFASHRTGRCNGRMLNHPVSGSGHLLLCGQHCLANSAVRTDCLARLITGRLHGGILHRLVPMRRDLGLLNANGMAGCAMLPFRQSVLSTGRRTGGIRHPGMPQRRHRLLRSQHAAADRAMLALGLARLLAGCRYGGINCLLVSRGRHLRLLRQHLMADRAVLALCLAGFGAGRRHRLIRDLGVTKCRYRLLCPQNFPAGGAMRPRRQSVLLAGGGHGNVDLLGMPGRRDGSGLFLSAVGTAEDIVPVVGTGRRLPGAGYLLHIMIAQSFRFRAGRRVFRLGIRFRLFLRQSKFYLTAIPDGVARDKRRAYRQYQQKQQGAQCPAEAAMSAQRHSFSHAVYLPYQNSHRAPARRASPGTYMRLEQADFRRKKTACPGIPSLYFPHIISYPPCIFKGFP